MWLCLARPLALRSSASAFFSSPAASSPLSSVQSLQEHLDLIAKCRTTKFSSLPPLSLQKCRSEGSWCTDLKACIELNQPNLFHQYYQFLWNHGEEFGIVQPFMRSTYITLMHGLLATDDFVSAFSLLRHVPLYTAQVSVRQALFDILICQAAQSGASEVVSQCLNNAREWDVQMQLSTYKAIVSGLSQAQLTQAMRWFKRAAAQELWFSDSFFSWFCDFVLQKNKPLYAYSVCISWINAAVRTPRRPSLLLFNQTLLQLLGDHKERAFTLIISMLAQKPPLYPFPPILLTVVRKYVHERNWEHVELLLNHAIAAKMNLKLRTTLESLVDYCNKYNLPEKADLFRAKALEAGVTLSTTTRAADKAMSSSTQQQQNESSSSTAPQSKS